MAKRILVDDLPTVPKVYTHVCVARNAKEDIEARMQFALHRMRAGECWDDWPDDEFIQLCMEPEFLADCTPLERELIVRLKVAVEYQDS